LQFFSAAYGAVSVPLELVANIFERSGIRKRTLGAWFSSGACILNIYAVIQMLVRILPSCSGESIGLSKRQCHCRANLGYSPHLISKQVVALISKDLIAIFAYFAFRETLLAMNKKSFPIALSLLMVALTELFLVWGWGFSG